MAAAALPSRGLTNARKELRAQLLKKQPRIHFKDERDSRRRQILDVICQQGWRVGLFTASPKRESIARGVCLDAIIQYVAAIGGMRLVIEVDDSVLQADKRMLFSAVERVQLAEGFTYSHMRARNEELLWVPDAIAWCFARGGEWRKRIEPVLDGFIEL